MCFREPRPRKRPTHSTIFYFCTAYCRYFSVQRLVLQCRKLSYDYHYSILGLQIKKFSSHVLCSRWRPRRGSGGNWKYPHNVRLYHLLMSFLSSFIMYFPRVKNPFRFTSQTRDITSVLLIRGRQCRRQLRLTSTVQCLRPLLMLSVSGR